MNSLYPFFTLPDPELVQESSVDPMGIQVIWTFYGQQIFDEKLTTVANDLRAFSFNLFHQHLLHRLQTEQVEAWQQAKEKYADWRTDLDVKTGLLMFLEDLVTWIFHEQSTAGQTDYHYTGILGMSKANRLAAANSRIELVASKRAGLLKNQLNLGMTGRYKGPMMKMGFFNRAFEVRETSEGVWPQVHVLMQNWEDAKQLEEQLITFLCQEVLVTVRQAGFPRKDLDAIKNSSYWKPLAEGYLACFGKASQHTALKDFWKSQLGLDQGAAWALYNALETNPPTTSSYHAGIFEQAISTPDLAAGEKQKLETIRDIEPFLSHSEYLLRYLAQRDVKKLSDHLAALGQLREAINSAAKFKQVALPSALVELRAVMCNEKGFIDWVNGVLKYHERLLLARGGNAWLSLGNKGVIQHHFSPNLNYKTVTEYLKHRPWFHTYYLETLRSILGGLNA